MKGCGHGLTRKLKKKTGTMQSGEKKTKVGGTAKIYKVMKMK